MTLGFSGWKIKEMRVIRGYSQEELAKRSRLARYTIARAELGKGKPRASTLRLLANTLGVDVEDFFVGEA